MNVTHENTLVGKAWDIGLLAQRPIWIDAEQISRDRSWAREARQRLVNLIRSDQDRQSIASRLADHP
jgi:hypothetical protein